MKILKKALLIFVSTISLASVTLSSVSASTEISTIEPPKTVITNQESDPIITPMYIPIPYSYIYTRFYTNTQLGGWLPTIAEASTTISRNTTVFGLFSIPMTVARPMAIMGYSSGTYVNASYIKYKSAYEKGMGLQVIVRNNPNYNGYNARTLVEWIPTYSAMR